MTRNITLGVTGTKKGMSASQQKTLLTLLKSEEWNEKYTITEFRHGDCVGVDVEVAQIIRDLYPNVLIICHPPTNQKHRGFFKSDFYAIIEDYLKRNKKIVDNSDMMFGFPFEKVEKIRSGSWSTIRYAKKKSKDLVIFYNDGSTS